MDSIFETRFVWLDRVDSTNTYCMKFANQGEPEGLAVASHFQEHGRGQRGNSWQSEEGKNLTFSLLLRPEFVKVEEQFAISKVIALAICDWLKNNEVEAFIKWPNDIYVGDRKIAGILIENSFSGPTLDISVIGIGLNLNQIVFSTEIPNPTSMSSLTGKTYQPETVLSEIIVSIQLRYYQLKFGLAGKVSDDYLKSLYRFQKFYHFILNNSRFKAKIVGIRTTGELTLETEDGQLKSYGFNEIRFDI
jgi:BirA family transcriptional regulator, biotin operon repressor / biotin---[acetyl-CoA-carboxylase] ligase